MFAEVRFFVVLKPMRCRRCVVPLVSGVSYLEPASKNTDTVEVWEKFSSDATRHPFDNVVISVFGVAMVDEESKVGMPGSGCFNEGRGVKGIGC